MLITVIKNAFAGLSVEQGRLLIMVGMQKYFVDLAWRYNDPGHAFMRFESTATIYVLALVLTFFCFTGNVTTTFGVCGGLAFKEMQHFGLSFKRADFNLFLTRHHLL